MDNRFTFFQEFLKHPLQVGSIIPSSRFLERSVVETAGVRSAKTIVELGAGTGGTTRAILRTMAPHAKLLSIEINPRFHVLVSRIKDDRLIVHLGSAHELQEIISIYGLNAPDVFISGIPFSTINHASGSQILETISSVLAPGGRFVAYQVSKRVATMCRPFLGPARMEMQFFNIPPLRIYQWEKDFT
jgi:phospholipid N-methyltransferase